MRNEWKNTITFVMLGMFLGWGMAAFTLTPNPYINLPIIMARGAELESAEHPVANLPLKLNYLLTAHGEHIIGLSQAKYEGGDLQRESDALEENNQQLASLASRIYGEKGRGMFLQMWKEHNLEIINYAEGVKLDDQIMQEKARQNLENITLQMHETIKSTNPDYPVDELSGLINTRIKLTLEIIDTFSQKDKSLEDVEEKINSLSDQGEKISEFLIRNLNASVESGSN